VSVELRIGDSPTLIKELPDGSVDLVACSPPFWALRDYGTGDTREIGSERSPAEFLAALLDLAVECRRVLTPYGSIAFELGDTFSHKGGKGGDHNKGELRESQQQFSGSARKQHRAGITDGGRIARGQLGKKWHEAASQDTVPGSRMTVTGTPPVKSLCGIPTLFAWSLAYGRNLLAQPMTATEALDLIEARAAEGQTMAEALWTTRRMIDMADASGAYAREFEPWLVRNVIVWARNNPPVGALGDKFRPATSYITVATPSKKRWFDLDAVRAAAPGRNTHARTARGVVSRPTTGKNAMKDGNFATLATQQTSGGAPPNDYWHDEYDGDLTWVVNPVGSPLSHFAMWPAKLAERIVLSMCPERVCRTCGEPSRRVTETTQVPTRNTNGRKASVSGTLTENFTERTETHVTTLGWTDCGHDAWRPGVVLDLFAGTCTTLSVAEYHGRDSVGFDLDPRSAAMLPLRREEVRKALNPTYQPRAAGQVGLWDEEAS
jgi:hypothetical protein